jgi:hypothetical protein
MMNTLSPCADHDAKWIEKVHSVHCYLVLLEFLPCTLRMSRLCKTSARKSTDRKNLLPCCASAKRLPYCGKLVGHKAEKFLRE